MPEQELLSAEEAASLLGVPLRTFNRWASQKKIPTAKRLGGSRGPRLFRRGDVHDLHDRDDRNRTDHEDVPFNPETAA